MDEQYRWTHTREVIAILYNINRGKNSTAKRGKDLYPLMIDKISKEDFEPLTPEQHDEIVKKLSKYIPKRHGR
jgi:hypothetical protein